MLVNGIGAWRSDAHHECGTVTVRAVQIKEPITFVTAFALLLHHHPSPFGSRILEPHLEMEESRGEDVVELENLYIDL